MPNPSQIPPFETLVTEAGYDLERLQANSAHLERLRNLYVACQVDPAAAMSQMFRIDREVQHAQSQCKQSAAAATKLQELISSLCSASATLGRLVGPVSGESPPKALCEIGNHLVELPVHPSVDLQEFATVEPWHMVRINDSEKVIVDVYRDEVLFSRALGDVVEFRGWYDREKGNVRIIRHGHDEEVVTLARGLRDSVLAVGDQLVLMRDAPSHVIAIAPTDSKQSRFEQSVDSFQTKLEDVAGFEPVIDSIVEDFILRVVYGEVRDRFALDPLRGALIYSYRPGMGKTMFARALVRFLKELGDEYDFDLECYVVKPSALKIVWHGGDGKLIREDLCGAMRARQTAPRTKKLIQVVIMDEIDSLGRRVGGDDGSVMQSAAQNDSVTALLAEIDGMAQPQLDSDQPDSHVLWLGLTNRPGSVDDALKRPGRFGDLLLEVPDATRDGAEAVLAVHSRDLDLPFYLDGAIRTDLDEAEIRSSFLRPAVSRVFNEVVLCYSTESARRVEVTAGELLANVHYKHAVSGAKRAAARRDVYQDGVAAITFEDIVDALIDQACSAARGVRADRSILASQLRVSSRITSVDIVPRDEIATHHFVKN